MKKEIIICICVIIFVIAIDMITQNYSKATIDKITDELTSYKDTLISKAKEKEENSKNEEKENKENEEKKQKIKDILNEFDDKYEVLSYYIEHEELEKVKTELVNIQANIETEEYKQANADINRAVFLLEHIKQKMSLQLKNIF